MDENNLIEQENVEESRERVLEVKLQELEIIVDQLELQLENDLDNEEYLEKYKNAKEEYDKLLKEFKSLKKDEQKKENKETTVKVWIYVYGFIQLVLCFPLISYFIWNSFADFILNIFNIDLIELANLPKTLYLIIVSLLFFSLPILDTILSWMLYVNVVKSKKDKKAFIIIWIMQSILSLGMMIWLMVSLFGNV